MKLIVFCLTIMIAVSCGSTKDISIWSKKYCNLERLEYQEVTDTIRRTNDRGFEGGVKANGKVILSDKINLDTVAAYLKGGNKVFINQTTFRAVKVSQDFYEKYSQNRASLCQIVEGVKSKIISSKEGKSRAEKLYLDMVYMFSGLREQDEKEAILNKSNFKSFVVELNSKIYNSDSAYKKYKAAGRKCSLIGDLYSKNVETLSFIQQNELLIKKVNLVDLQQLTEHLKVWNKAYEQQFSDRNKLKNETCAVDYQGPSYPVNIPLKIKGLLNSLQ